MTNNEAIEYLTVYAKYYPSDDPHYGLNYKGIFFHRESSSDFIEILIMNDLDFYGKYLSHLDEDDTFVLYDDDEEY